jgi:X-Pro dipeptidyl-peptidase
MRIGVRSLVASGMTLTMLALGTGAAHAQAPQLENGKTKAVYDYKTAVRERVFIPQPGIDVDRNGKDDFVTADIIRPAASSATNKMPAIIDPSPYYVTSCRGNESQCMSDWNNDNVNDRWPLFYDNYFVPRGYAYVLAQMNGTGYTEEGCPMHGGPTDIAGEKSVVDWLNGRTVAYKPKAGTSTTPDLQAPVVADWHNGSSAMIGKSYDGTLSNGVAATGVEGLKTIVPVSAISAWYNYSRRGGIRQNTNYPGGSLNPGITYGGTPPSGHNGGINLPNRKTVCAPVNAEINDDAKLDTGDGDAHGDINTFWRDRDYVKDANKVKAAVFATHGLQDDNVKMDHMAMWWEALGQNNVPRKLWLLRAGHEDPFDSRRAEWVSTLHRWFDYWLYNVPNGIMSEKAVTVEEERDVWADYSSWPIDGTQNVDLFLRATSDPAAAGTLGGKAGGGAADSLAFTARTSTNETATGANAALNLLNTPTGAQTYRRVFLSQALKTDLRLSGTAVADLAASIGATQSNFSVIVADYGALNADGSRQTFTQTSRSDEGITNGTIRTCWGDSGNNALTGEAGPACGNLGDVCATNPPREVDNACYLEGTKPLSTQSQWRVTRGVRDSANRNSLWYLDASPVTIGDKFRIPVVTMAQEHIFKAGHQVAIIVAGSNTSDASGTGNDNVAVTLDTRTSKITLPIKGGYAAAVSAGLTDAETEAPTLGAVPADIATATTDATGTTVTYTLPTATDNEDPNPVVTCDPASGSKFAVGTTTVTCVAKDANGNTSAPKTFTVVVRRDVPAGGTVGGSVGATLALSLGTPAQFGAFTPGILRTYLASSTATVTSTAGDALLTVSDPSAVGTGHLVNGTFVLPEPLQARARNAANTGTAYNNIGSSLNLLVWNGPVSNDAVTLEFSQLVKANDPLRTGTYSKALTYTLSTTTP